MVDIKTLEPGMMVKNPSGELFTVIRPDWPFVVCHDYGGIETWLLAETVTRP